VVAAVVVVVVGRGKGKRAKGQGKGESCEELEKERERARTWVRTWEYEQDGVEESVSVCGRRSVCGKSEGVRV
jgi:hypothetical protein